MLALLILAALVATLVAGAAVLGAGSSQAPKSSRRREAPALRSRRPKVRDLPDYDSGTPRSGMRMRLWF